MKKQAYVLDQKERKTIMPYFLFSMNINLKEENENMKFEENKKYIEN